MSQLGWGDINRYNHRVSQLIVEVFILHLYDGVLNCLLTLTKSLRFPLIVKQGTMLLNQCEIISENGNRIIIPVHDQKVFRLISFILTF